MKTLNLNLPYKRSQEATAQSSNVDFTALLIGLAVESANEKGLEGKSRRVFGRLQRKLDAAIDASQESVEVEDAELDLINDSLKRARFLARQSKHVLLIEEELERIAKAE